MPAVTWSRTLWEPWTVSFGPTGPYAVAAMHASQVLGLGEGRSCLVIGSAPAEAVTLASLDWRVTHLDYRQLDPETPWPFTVCQGDAMALPFPDHTFDAISSTCVLCHVGTGRYGDPQQADGEARMLRECRRVLRPGGSFVCSPGPVYLGDDPVDLPPHRVTTVEAFHRLVQAHGWHVQHCAVGGINTDFSFSTDPTAPDYLCATLEAC